MAILQKCTGCNDDGAITDFTEGNATTDPFNLKEKLTGQTDKNGTKKC